MPDIHSSAIVDTNVELGEDVVVGAFSIIEKDVVIGARTRIDSHVVIRSHTSIGIDSQIFQFCSIGEQPQHLEYAGESTRLEIGARNIIREYCSLNCGTSSGLGVTRLGDDNFIMAYAHIAHDCTLGNHVVFANGASLAGHVNIGDYAILGGFVGVHQYCNIGTHSIVGLGAMCIQDVPPYIVAAGNPAAPFGINSRGLARRNFNAGTIALLKKAYRLLYRKNFDLKTAIAAIEEIGGESTETVTLCDFLRASKRGTIR